MEPITYENAKHLNTKNNYYEQILSPVNTDTEKNAKTERTLDHQSNKKRKERNVVNIKLQNTFDFENNYFNSIKNNLQNILIDNPRIQNSVRLNTSENKKDLSDNTNKIINNGTLNLLYKKSLIKSQGNTKSNSLEKNYKNNHIVYKKRQSHREISRKSNHKDLKNNNIDKSDLSLSLLKMSYSTLYGNEFADNSISFREINSIITCNNNKNKKNKNDNNFKGLLNANQQPIIINDSNCHNYYNSFYLKEGYLDKKNPFLENSDSKNKNIEDKSSKTLKAETKLYKNAIIISMRHLQKFCKLHLFKSFLKFFNILNNWQNKKINNIYHKKTSTNSKKCQYFSPNNKNSVKISYIYNSFSDKKNLYKSQIVKGEKSYDVFLKEHKSKKGNCNGFKNIYIKKRTVNKSIEPMKLDFVDDKSKKDQNKLLYKPSNKYFTLRKESSEEKEETLQNNNDNPIIDKSSNKNINIHINVIPYMIKNSSNIIKYENLCVVNNDNINIQSENEKKKLKLKAKVFHKIIKHLRRKIKYFNLLNVSTLIKKKFFKHFLAKLNNIKQVNNISTIKNNSNKSLFSIQESDRQNSDGKSVKNQRFLSSSFSKSKAHVVRIKKIKVIESTINEIIPKAVSQDKKLNSNRKYSNKEIIKDDEYNFRKKYLLKKFVTKKKNIIKKYFENWLKEIKNDSKRNDINSDNNDNNNININNGNYDSNVNTDESFPKILSKSCKILLHENMNPNEAKENIVDFISVFRSELILFAFKSKNLNNNSVTES